MLRGAPPPAAIDSPLMATDFGGSNLLFSFSINAGFDGYAPVVPEGVCDVPLPFEPPVGPIDWASDAGRAIAEHVSAGGEG